MKKWPRVFSAGRVSRFFTVIFGAGMEEKSIWFVVMVRLSFSSRSRRGPTKNLGVPWKRLERENSFAFPRALWLRLLGNPEILFRFDVVEIVLLEGAPPRIELVRDAFQLSEPYLY